MKTVVVACRCCWWDLVSGVADDTVAVLVSVSATAGALMVTVIGAAAPTASDGRLAVMVPPALLMVQPVPDALWYIASAGSVSTTWTF